MITIKALYTNISRGRLLQCSAIGVVIHFLDTVYNIFTSIIFIIYDSSYYSP